jgi:D-glycero-D-manno-heptose 1,7-bisphosphate phosphatase
MGSNGLRPVVFVDRDGVLIENREHYVRTWEEVEIFPGSIEAGRMLTAAGLGLVVVTNQALVGRGYLPLEVVSSLNNRILDCFKDAGVEIIGRYMCPHHPDDNCGCRKPKPGMLLQAAKEHGIDLSNSYLVGDATSDLLAAEAAGVTGILVRTGRGVSEEPKVAQDYNARWVVQNDFLAAATYILASKGAQG